ncbi:hypothetical protein HanRHA438_Chr09g0407601 [Helianthus annuus]|nr:hypothetical protein HanIR_Chr09g0426741 [Helianthus annuus]KAJ0888946.1 hypothetical protein HanRHA438_Chr09g0407601 [Helianthus annuus]
MKKTVKSSISNKDFTTYWFSSFMVAMETLVTITDPLISVFKKIINRPTGV